MSLFKLTMVLLLETPFIISVLESVGVEGENIFLTNFLYYQSH